MKNYKTVPDTLLLQQIRTDAANERSAGLAVIHQLREISRRRLDIRLGYSSLHQFCMEELKYSPGSSWRRIKAMKALQDLPELETQIAQGDLTLANVSQVQSFCDQKGKTLEEKKEILNQVSGLSKRETEKVLATIAPLPVRPDKVREHDGNQTELRVTLNAETVLALDKVRNLIAHVHPGATYAEVIAYLAKLGLNKLDPAIEKRPRKTRPPGDPLAPGSRAAAAPGLAPAPARRSPPQSAPIPASVRREVWRRDGGKCGYPSAESGKICGASAWIQMDHAVPRAKGGGNEPSNLRLRCQAHNIQDAIQELGIETMQPYLRAIR